MTMRGPAIHRIDCFSRGWELQQALDAVAVMLCSQSGSTGLLAATTGRRRLGRAATPCLLASQQLADQALA